MLLLFIKFFSHKNTTEIRPTEKNLGNQNRNWVSKTEFRASQQNEIEISETEQKLTMSQFLLCFSDEPSGTWVRASWKL